MGSVPPQGAATLVSNPRNLHVLWQEYEHGMDGSKPAKLFTTRERGRTKFKYHRRKVLWDRIRTLMERHGHSSETAIQHLYATYGRGSCVTKIINEMIRDRLREKKDKDDSGVIDNEADSCEKTL